MTDILVRHKALPALVTISVALAIALSSCSELSEQQTQRVQEALNDSLITSTETWGVDMELIEEGQDKIRMTGSYAASYLKGNRRETRIQGPVSIEVYDSSGSVSIHVNSERAIYRAEQSEFELFGDVRVRTREKRILLSEYLKWSRIDNNITTPKFVIIITPRDSLAGTGFQGTTDLSSYSIKRPSGEVILD